MDGAPLKTGTNTFNGDSHSVKFENVRFGYKDAEVLHGIDLELKEDTMTALVMVVVNLHLQNYLYITTTLMAEKSLLVDKILQT